VGILVSPKKKGHERKKTPHAIQNHQLEGPRQVRQRWWEMSYPGRKIVGLQEKASASEWTEALG